MIFESVISILKANSNLSNVSSSKIEIISKVTLGQFLSTIITSNSPHQQK